MEPRACCIGICRQAYPEKNGPTEGWRISEALKMDVQPGRDGPEGSGLHHSVYMRVETCLNMTKIMIWQF